MNTPVAVITVPFFQTDQSLVLADETMRSVQSSSPLLTIAMVNAFRQEQGDALWIGANFDHVEYREQNNLAAAWNQGIATAFGAGVEFALLLNLDVVLHQNTIDNLIALARSTPDELIWSGTEYRTREEFESAKLDSTTLPGIHYSCFMISRQFVEIAGAFDEQFEPAYYEDSDMTRRLALLEKRGLITKAAPFFHLHMGTFKSAVTSESELEGLGKKIEQITVTNEERYLKKWGGVPYAEKFRTPYNR